MILVSLAFMPHVISFGSYMVLAPVGVVFYLAGCRLVVFLLESADKLSTEPGNAEVVP